ncbi:MAG: HAD hydrolase-like protein [Oscillospiraceae bacterium]|nr:HAD hydrolase-like protein [Oscillospiraceae bacterium]
MKRTSVSCIIIDRYPLKYYKRESHDKMRSRCIIFDLDGTLLDTSPGILESVEYAAGKMGYPQLSQDQLLSFIGPPLQDSFMRCYGCDRGKADELTAAYREHYRAGALLVATPYAGIFDLCDLLRSEGKRIMVATSKPQQFAVQILDHFGFVFDAVHGVDFAGKLGKVDMICSCVLDTGYDPMYCVMVGDTEYDAKGAQEAGVPFIGVSYGFGDPAEMSRYPNIGIADCPMDVLRILNEG